VSRRITFLYGKLYEHGRLNAQTYDYGLDELFGPANLTLLEHLGMLVRAGHLVDAGGGEVYMSRFADRLRLPITFLHGAEDRHYLPESSERTYQHLIAQNGHERYERHVLPGYGHIDPIIGKDAAREVYPLILAALTATT
jgi:cholesterol oxidase